MKTEKIRYSLHLAKSFVKFSIVCTSPAAYVHLEKSSLDRQRRVTIIYTPLRMKTSVITRCDLRTI